jgi:dolichyl-phosphate-mannose-protein mannosyltransferase
MNDQYDQYDNTAAAVITTSTPSAMSEAAKVSAPPAGAPKDLPIVSKEERVEYRDENGRVLDEEEVKALAGKVSFKTRYETRTRIVDAQGNEVHEALVEAREEEGETEAREEEGEAETREEEGETEAREEEGETEAEAAGVAPPHPEVEGRNPETKNADEPEPEASEVPPTVEVGEDLKKEKSVEKEANEPKPASEAQAATGNV